MDNVQIQRNVNSEITVNKSPYEEFVQNRILLNQYYSNEQQTTQMDRESVKEALSKNYNFDYKYSTMGLVSLKEDDKQLDEKEREKQEKKRIKETKKVRKHYPVGTEHTLGIIEQHNQAMNDRIQYEEPLFAETMPSEQLVKARAEQKLFDIAGKELKIEKSLVPFELAGAIISAEKYDYSIAYKFTPEYIAKNYADTVKTLDRIMAVADYIRLSGSQPIIKDGESNRPLDYDFLKYADYCKEMFDNALLANGLKVGENPEELVAASVKECEDAAFKNMDAANKLKQLFDFREAGNKLNDDLYRFKSFYRTMVDALANRANEDISEKEELLFKVTDEIRMMEAINRKLYSETEHAEQLTQQELEYAQRNGYLKDNAYKEQIKANVEMYNRIERSNENTEPDVILEQLKGDISELCEKLLYKASFEELDKYREQLYRVSSTITKIGINKCITDGLSKMKTIKIFALAEKLRAHDLESAANSGSINIDDLSELERYTIGMDGNTLSVDIKEYAKKQYVLADKMYEDMMTILYADEEFINVVTAKTGKTYKQTNREFTSKHKEMSAFFQGLINEADGKEESSYQYKEYRRMYMDLKKEKLKLEKKMAEIPDSSDEYLDLYMEVTYLETEMFHLQVKYKLAKENKYSVYGGEETRLSGAFRSLFMFEHSVEGDMEDTDFFVMIEKLVSGTFEENATETEKEQYKRDNYDALYTIKSNAIKRNKLYFNMYGLEIKDVDYIMEHYDEIKELSTLAQNDEQLLETKSIWNKEDETDLLAWNLLKFYNYYFSLMLNKLRTIAQLMNDPKEKYKRSIETQKVMWDIDLSGHYDYLKKHEGDIANL